MFADFGNTLNMNPGLSGLPPLPKSLSGMLNSEEDSLPSFTHGLQLHTNSAFRPVAVGGSSGRSPHLSGSNSGQQQSLYANTRPRIGFNYWTIFIIEQRGFANSMEK